MDIRRVIFMGTPQFAVPTLRALRDSQYELLAVVTNPDRPKGRGRVMVGSPVKQVANEFGCLIFQPETVRSEAFLRQINELNPDVIVVVAYGQILTTHVLDIPRYGAINVHASLLPKYRGAAPIQWAIINGEKRTGVTTMWMDKGMDTGDILLKAETEIGPSEDAQLLHDRLSLIGSGLLIDTLARLRVGTLDSTPQATLGGVCYAPSLRKEHGQIDWTKDAQSLDYFVRGMNPWPGSYTFYSGKRLKVYKAKPATVDNMIEPPGTVSRRFPDELCVATGQGGWLLLDEVQLESGKRLSAGLFLRGVDIPDGAVLG